MWPDDPKKLTTCTVTTTYATAGRLSSLIEVYACLENPEDYCAKQKDDTFHMDSLHWNRAMVHKNEMQVSDRNLWILWTIHNSNHPFDLSRNQITRPYRVHWSKLPLTCLRATRLRLPNKVWNDEQHELAYTLTNDNVCACDELCSLDGWICSQLLHNLHMQFNYSAPVDHMFDLVANILKERIRPTISFFVDMSMSLR